MGSAYFLLPLLSTGNCKISDFSEKDNLGGFKIEFFSRPTVNLPKESL